MRLPQNPSKITGWPEVGLSLDKGQFVGIAISSEPETFTMHRFGV